MKWYKYQIAPCMNLERNSIEYLIHSYHSPEKWQLNVFTVDQIDRFIAARHLAIHNNISAVIIHVTVHQIYKDAVTLKDKYL